MTYTEEQMSIALNMIALFESKDESSEWELFPTLYKNTTKEMQVLVSSILARKKFNNRSLIGHIEDIKNCHYDIIFRYYNELERQSVDLYYLHEKYDVTDTIDKIKTFTKQNGFVYTLPYTRLRNMP